MKSQSVAFKKERKKKRKHPARNLSICWNWHCFSYISFVVLFLCFFWERKRRAKKKYWRDRDWLSPYRSLVQKRGFTKISDLFFLCLVLFPGEDQGRRESLFHARFSRRPPLVFLFSLVTLSFWFLWKVFQKSYFFSNHQKSCLLQTESNILPGKVKKDWGLVAFVSRSRKNILWDIRD